MCEGVLGTRIDSFVEGFREGYMEKTGKECGYSYDRIKLIALMSIFKRDMIDIFQAAEQADITVQEFEQRLKSNIYDEIPPKVIVLGLTEFDDTVFTDKIENILVTKPNELLFKFRDGHEQLARWKDHSRADSWTPEKRLEASRRAKWKNK